MIFLTKIWENAYMSIPPRYEKIEKYSTLKKVLYNLKQSPRIQFERPRDFIKNQEYHESNGDTFVKKTEVQVMFFLVYILMI